MKRLTQDEFIKKAKALHGDKYDYSQVNYINMHTNVDIICKEHGLFSQAPSNHLRGRGGCCICNRYLLQRRDFNDVISQANKCHNNKYDYSKYNYVNNRTKSIIICPVHGEFHQNMTHHLRGKGCPLCASNHKDDKQSFIEKARAIHGDIYDYSEVEYVNSFTKVKIIDPEFGCFYQTPNSHLNGRGSWSRRASKINETKRKNNTFNTSSTEIKVYDYLVNKFGKNDVLKEFTSEKYPFSCDFYIKSLDLYIEMNVYFSHGGHFYDECKDAEKLNVWKEKALHSDLYKKAIHTWTVSDVLKRKTALLCNLNYLTFWDYDLSDFLDWLNSFDETHCLCNLY